MVAHVFQFPQIVGGDQHRGPPLGHVPHEQGPDLTPHHRVQAVYRLVQDQQVGVAAQSQPKGGLLLHPLGQAADGLFLVYCREGLLQHLIALVIKGGIQPPVKLHHVPGGGGQKVVQVVGDKGHPGLHRRIFVHRRPVHRDGARVGAVDAGDVPQMVDFPAPLGPTSP